MGIDPAGGRTIIRPAVPTPHDRPSGLSPCTPFQRMPPEHLAWFVIDAVESMDLSPFYGRELLSVKGE